MFLMLVIPTAVNQVLNSNLIADGNYNLTKVSNLQKANHGRYIRRIGVSGGNAVAEHAIDIKVDGKFKGRIYNSSTALAPAEFTSIPVLAVPILIPQDTEFTIEQSKVASVSTSMLTIELDD